MKKKFSIVAENKKPARQVDAIKHEINKYVARERRKDIPEGFDYWDFDCGIGLSQEEVRKIHLKEINKEIDKLVEDGKEEFYLEVMAVSKKRNKKN